MFYQSIVSLPPKSNLVTLILCSFSLLFFASFKESGINNLSTAEVVRLRGDISGYAKNFTGIAYRYAGVSPRTGFDCSGFTSYIFKEFGLNVSSASSAQARQGDKIDLDDVQPGDLVFFGRRGHVSHVAMVTECNTEGIVCVHSTCSRGVVVENVSTSSYWKSKIMFARDVIAPQAAN